MKTTIKRNVLVALMFGTLIGYAKENTEPTKKVGSNMVKVEFNDVKKGHTLTIKDKKGVQIYSRIIESTGTFSKTFDLSALENGNYVAELNKDFEIILKTFNVKNGIVTFLSKKNQKVFKPVIRKKGDLILISKIAFDKQPLKVVLYYEDEEIIRETIKGEDYLKRIYKLSDSEKGDYKIVILSNERMYIKDFRI
jgi:hypothetical protein